ncbi:NACHT domain-containing protein [Gigaspora margarita]|uniref:NACHT domain-containing protein n=1 Tax=Gigaspora margarita TaxID=4874 RepID=A0A8H3XBZ3_GIGMA|nr:NACHT domain-containing protein [Gigaspora margarita]
MFVDNNKVVVDYDQMNEKISSEWERFLGNTDIELLLLRFSMPLFRRGNQYWFFHKSLRDYLISCALLDSLKDTSQATRFNVQSIAPEPAIQQFLAEQVQQMPEYERKPLFKFIEYSKRDRNIQIASANAITVLSRASMQHSVNLNNIRVPGADLSNGDFNNLQFVRADLNNVNFNNAKLQSTNFKGACLQNANLQNANLQNANFEGASLQDANLNGANLSGANLRRSILLGVKLYNSNLNNVNFEGASLRIRDFHKFVPNTNFGDI